MPFLDQALPSDYNGQPTVYLLYWADREGKADEIAKYGVEITVDDAERCTVYRIRPIEDFAYAADTFIQNRRAAAEVEKLRAQYNAETDRLLAPAIAQIERIKKSGTPEQKAQLAKIARGED